VSKDRVYDLYNGETHLGQLFWLKYRLVWRQPNGGRLVKFHRSVGVRKAAEGVARLCGLHVALDVRSSAPPRRSPGMTEALVKRRQNDAPSAE
jgi:hypothetical protein